MKAILFDLDDTLHDKSSTLGRMADQQFSTFSLSDLGVATRSWLDRYLVLHNQLIPKAEVFEKLSSEFKLGDDIQKRLLENYDSECGKNAQAFPGMSELMTMCLDRGVALGCVTNGRDGHQRSKLDGLEISSSFDSIVTSGEFGEKKPALAMFKQCLAELEVDAADSVMVGDSYEADIVPALALGMRAIWKSDRYSAEVEFCSDSLLEIRSYLFG